MLWSGSKKTEWKGKVCRVWLLFGHAIQPTVYGLICLCNCIAAKNSWTGESMMVNEMEKRWFLSLGWFWSLFLWFFFCWWFQRFSAFNPKVTWTWVHLNEAYVSTGWLATCSLFYQKSEAQNDLIYFRRVIQYFNKHLLSDWQSDSGQKAGRDNGGNYGVQRARLDTFNMTLVRTVSLPEMLILPSRRVVRTVVRSDCFSWFMTCPTVPSSGWCWILGRNMCLGDRSTGLSRCFPQLLCLGKEMLPKLGGRGSRPRGSGRKHIFWVVSAGFDDSSSEFHRWTLGKIAGKKAMPHWSATEPQVMNYLELQDFLRAFRSRQRGDSSDEAFKLWLIDTHFNR